MLLPSSSSSDLDESVQPTVKFLTPDGHLDRVKWILHDVVSIQLVYLLHHGIHVRLLWFGEEQEFDPCLCLKALDTEMAGLHDFDTCRAVDKG